MMLNLSDVRDQYHVKIKNVVLTIYTLPKAINPFLFASWTQFGFISVLGSTALWKLEITVCFLWLSLPVHIVSLMSISNSKQYDSPLLTVFTALEGTHFFNFICYHFSWCTAAVVVICGDPKITHRIPSTVKLYFFFVI